MAGKNWSAQELFQMSVQNWMALTLQAAVKLDLFTALDQEEGQETCSLALAKGYDPRALDMLVTALVALGLLEKDGQLIRLTQSSRSFLSAKSSQYMGHGIKHSAHILNGWLKLDQAVKTGHSVAERSSVTTEIEEEREAFLMAMYNVASFQAGAVAEVFKLEGRRRLLDVGGGPGTYAAHFCLNNQNLKAVVFDQPTTEPFAKTVLEKLGVSDRVSFQGGNFNKDPLPSGFDVVWLSQVLHGESPAEAARLVKKAADSLESNGLMGIQEFVLDDDRKGPVQPALFALNMLVQTPGGQTYTESEIKKMMEDAGLSVVERLPAPPPCGIMVASKK